MARKIAIQIGDQYATVAAATVQSGRAMIDRFFTVDLAEETDAGGLELAPLKTALDENGLTRGDVTVIVSRSRIEMRQFNVPNVPADELPGIVNLQAQQQFASINQDWAVDYAELPSSGAVQKQILAVAISPGVLAPIKRLFERSGLRLQNVVVRPFAAAQLIAGKKPDPSCRLMVDRNGNEFDLTLIQGGAVMMSRTVLATQAEPAGYSLVREIKRTMLAAGPLVDGQQPHEILIVGNQDEQIQKELQKQFDCKISSTDPLSHCSLQTRNVTFDDVGNVSAAALVGALENSTRGNQHLLDFLNPRQTHRESIWTRQRIFIAAGSAVAVALLVLVGTWWMLSSKQKTIQTLEAQLEKLLDENNDIDERLARINEIDEFQQLDINWLNEMVEITKILPDPDRAVVDVFKGRVGSRGIPVVDLSIRVSDPKTEQKFKADADRKYELDWKDTRRLDKTGTYNRGTDISLFIPLIDPDDQPFMQHAVDSARNNEPATKPAESETTAADDAPTNDETQ